ncbi:MAG: CPBP family intramembrane metalloprotease [Paludibacteraceae bacterium]|nr:CPBP family intramembrane metalloprotease [Paludibacteraceae bacterium]
MILKGIFEKESIWIKVLFLILLPIVLGIMFMAFSMGLTKIFGITDYVAIIKLHQIMSAIGIFILSSFILAYFFSKKPFEFIGFKQPYGRTVLVAIFSIIFALPLINFITIICSNISLPDSLSGVEDFLTNAEKRNEELTLTLLEGNSYWDLFINMTVLALVPAVGEEMLFRGIILKSLLKNGRNIHVCIWITALLFSLVHVQFHKFIPILLLGGYLGYLRVWSQNIWVPMAVHFTNNLLVVLFYFFLKGNDFGLDIENVGTSGSPFILISSIILSIAAIYTVWVLCNKKQGLTKKISEI